VEASEHTE